MGALVVKDGQVIGRALISDCRHDPSVHAAGNCWPACAATLGNYRPDGCSLYVDAGACSDVRAAIQHARIARLVFRRATSKTGAAGSVVNLFAEPRLNHHTAV